MAYSAKTFSMAATNSPLIAAIHHWRCRHGLSSFFQKRPNGFWRDLLDEPQLDGFARQQAQRPMVVAVGHGLHTMAMRWACCAPVRAWR
jgi:hypothetical protein